ncbi:MAG: hypothetical protein ABIE74_01570, partial [Pseudomonadota bacterium]
FTCDRADMSRKKIKNNFGAKITVFFKKNQPPNNENPSSFFKVSDCGVATTQLFPQYADNIISG